LVTDLYDHLIQLSFDQQLLSLSLSYPDMILATKAVYIRQSDESASPSPATLWLPNATPCFRHASDLPGEFAYVHLSVATQ